MVYICAHVKIGVFIFFAHSAASDLLTRTGVLGY